MQKIGLFLLLYGACSSIAYAIPIPTLLVWADFFLLLIPSVISIFWMIFFYFKKYTLWISIGVLFFIIQLYIFYYWQTRDFIFYEYEYFLFLIFIGFTFYSYKIGKRLFIHYILLFLYITAVFFMLKVNHNMYLLHKLWDCVEKSMYSNFSVEKTILKSSFIAIYVKDIETDLHWYTVIWKWSEVEHCTSIWDYHICNWWNSWIWEWLSSLWYLCIEN